MEEELRARLLGVPAVSGIVGDRVNFGVHPQGAPLPGVVMNTVSDAQGAFLAAPDGLSEARVQVDCYAESYGGAKVLARAVRAALAGYEGGAIQGVIELSLRDGFAGDTADGQRPWRVTCEYRVIYTI